MCISCEQDITAKRHKRVAQCTWCCCVLVSQILVGHTCFGDYTGATSLARWYHHVFGCCSQSSWLTVIKGCCAWHLTECCMNENNCHCLCCCGINRCQRVAARKWNQNCHWLINAQCVDQCGQRPELADAMGAARPLLLAQQQQPAPQVMAYDGRNETTCVICWEEFKDTDVLRTLLCQHNFHANCVDEWLRDNPSCPTCRRPIVMH